MAEQSACHAVLEAASAYSGGLLGPVHCETSAGMGNSTGTSFMRLLMGCLYSLHFLGPLSLAEIQQLVCSGHASAVHLRTVQNSNCALR